MNNTEPPTEVLAAVPPSRRRVFVDTETTGLHAAAQAFELAWQSEDEMQPTTLILPHNLHAADPAALQINQYRERGIAQLAWATEHQIDDFRLAVTGANLIIANPVFDVPHLMTLLGFQVWHYRITDIESYAQAIFGDSNPPGMSIIYERLTQQGYRIPEPDHTAAGDVRTLVASFTALNHMGDTMREGRR